jgi:hypothetical protein
MGFIGFAKWRSALSLLFRHHLIQAKQRAGDIGEGGVINGVE